MAFNYNTLPGLSGHAHPSSSSLPEHLQTHSHSPFPQPLPPAPRTQNSPPVAAFANNSYIPGLSDASSGGTWQPPLPSLYNASMSLSTPTQQPISHGAQPHTYPHEDAQHFSGMESSEGMEEGELSDSDADAAIPTVPDTSSSANEAPVPGPSTHARTNGSSNAADLFSLAYLLEQRQMAKNFIKVSGFTYQQLVQEGLNEAMLWGLYNELGISTEQAPQAPQAALPKKSPLTLSSATPAQQAKPVNREEYLARLKALQKKPALDKPSQQNSDAGNGAVAAPGDALAKNDVVEKAAQKQQRADSALIVKNISNEQQLLSIFAWSGGPAQLHVERIDKDAVVYFSSPEDKLAIWNHIGNKYKKASEGALHVKHLIETQDAVQASETSTKTQSILDKDGIKDGTKDGTQDPAALQRKEKLARLREEALKSAKAAQAKKEQLAAAAAAKAEQFLDDLGTSSHSSGTPMSSTSTLKRPLTTLADDITGAAPVKRPFGQPRYDDEQNDCIIEASDDEVDSESGRGSHQRPVQVTASAAMTPKSTHSVEGLEAHELRILEMRRRIVQLESRNKAKAISGNASPAQDAQIHKAISSPGAMLTPATPAPQAAFRGETPIPHGVSPVEWKKQRRTQIQSTLPAYNAKVASTANRLALLRQQMKDLEESMLREEAERQQLLHELEALGMDTDGIPDMPIEELKATRDDLTANLDAQATDKVSIVKAQELVPSLQQEQKNSGTSVSTGEGETTSSEDEGGDAMDISNSDSDADEGYEPQEARTNSIEEQEEEAYEPPDAGNIMPAPLQNTQLPTDSVSEDEDEDIYEPTEASAVALNTIDLNRIPDLQNSGEALLQPAVPGSDGEDDSIYADEPAVEQSGSDEDGQIRESDDLGLSSSEAESRGARVEESHPSSDARNATKAPDSASFGDSASSSGDAPMDQSEDEDEKEDEDEENEEDYEPAEASGLQGSGVAPASPADSLYDEGPEDEDDEAYNPPDADSVMEDVHRPQTNKSQPAVSAESSLDAFGDSDVGATICSCPRSSVTEIHPNVGQKSMRKKSEVYTPYESPLKLFKWYREQSKPEKESSGGPTSLTYNHNIDVNKPLCAFETAGGVCNDARCEGQHFRSMSVPAERFLAEVGAASSSNTE
ncbi:hypothetical protein FH972_025115 [Carpinus fangiana]|uniref:Putative zinc-finger domain-containing protein n=1 Tax=Carpinus fangiana TaxID=176857 RepID=A0A5N6L103_9ROSI|nr:hypothetical protein FH972_025115 [Carpinus fangiana]